MTVDTVPSAPWVGGRTVRHRRLSWRLLLGIVLLAAAMWALTEMGIAYRRWGWDITAVARFRGDIHRNFTFGEMALKDGYLNVHENQLRDNPPYSKKLDYPPLRLLTFEAWAAWMHAHYPGQAWREEYDFHAPLMRYYTVLEWLAAAGAFLIVWHWRRRCARPVEPSPGELHGRPALGWTGITRAVGAFALLWFDPGVLIIGHGWPSPNIWSLPFYLWPVLLCLWDCWFLAGLVLSVGTMMQGQLLSVVAVFILWPIFAGRPLRLFRWVSGFMLGFMLIASPWMLSIRPDIPHPERVIHWTPIVWITLSLALLAVVSLRRSLRERMHWGWFVVPALVAVGVLVTPAVRVLSPVMAAWTLVGCIGLTVLFWVASCSIRRYLFPLVLALCLLACVPFFGASTAWWQVGFLYGAERFPHVATVLASNLSTLLEQFLGWKQITDTAVELPLGMLWVWPSEPIVLSVRQVLGALFAILLVLNAFFIARQWRLGRTNLLVALVLPWVLFFTVMPQMSPRYTVFAAGVGAICIGHSFGMTLLTWFFSLLTVLQTGLCMMWGARSYVVHDPNWFFNLENLKTFEVLIPSLAWAEVLVCLIFIYVAFKTRPRGGGRTRLVEPPSSR